MKPNPSTDSNAPEQPQSTCGCGATFNSVSALIAHLGSCKKGQK